MTEKRFLEVIDNIDDRFIRETEEDLRKRDEGHVARRLRISSVIGAAACAAAALTIGFTAVSYYKDRAAVLPSSNSSSTPEAPMQNGEFTELSALADAPEEFSALKQNGAGMLDFSNAELTLPEVTGDLYQLTVTPTPDMPSSELLELFFDSVKHTYPDSAMTDDIENYSWMRYTFMPFTDEYIKEIQSGEIQLKYVMYDTSNNENAAENEYLLMDKCGAVKIWRKFSDLLYFSPYGKGFNITDRYILSGAAMPADGNEGVYKAAAFCDEYFSNTLPFTELPNAKRLSAEVMLTDNGLYKVILARSFNGVLFDTLGNSKVCDDWDFKYFRIDGGSALISEDGELLYAMIDSYNDILTPDGERIDSIISLEEAAEIAGQVPKFKITNTSVKNVSLVYCDYCLNPYLSYAKSYSNARLSWRFAAEDTLTRYYVYVDAIDGTVSISERDIETDYVDCHCH